MKKEFKEFDIDFNPKQICTVKLARKLYPKLDHHNLDTLIEKFNLVCKRRHRAFDDALCLWQFYQIIQKEFNSKQLKLSLDKINKKPSRPIHLSDETMENLPKSPGVYIFYGEKGMPLYIGKSINIKKRVLSHFSSDCLNSKELKIAQQVQDIKTITTAGELGALILESQLVKKLQPLYNRMLRNSRKMTVLKCQKNLKGFNSVYLETNQGLDIDNFEEVLGIFKSVKQAKNFLISLSKEHKLCEKLLGLENLTKECFGYRLGRCKGACVGKENYKIYNLRFQIAFAKYKLRSWPFDGPILIEEKDGEREVVQSFTVDKWCILENSSDDLTDFDLDTYKILERYIRSSKNQRNIRFLGHKRQSSQKTSLVAQTSF